MTGKELAQEINKNLKMEIASLSLSPKLAVIQVGDNYDSSKYISTKQKACAEVGISFEHIHLSVNTTEDKIISAITRLNEDINTTGIIVQLPLPEGYNVSNILEYINPDKDVDGLTSINAGRLVKGMDGLFPATAEGVVNLLRYYKVPLIGSEIVVVGRSNLVGKPLSLMLLNEGATITVCHSKTKNLRSHTIRADIIVSAVGKKGLIKADMIKDNAVVLDVGMDVDFEEVSRSASYITPPIGGVGPMTVAMLLSNVVKAAKEGQNG